MVTHNREETMAFIDDELAHQFLRPQTEREHRLVEVGALVGFAFGGGMVFLLRVSSTDPLWFDASAFIVSLVLMNVFSLPTKFRHLEYRIKLVVYRWAGIE